MFTDYHLEKLIQAINDAEERQTKAIVAAIKEVAQPKPKSVFMSTPKGGIDMFEQAFAEAESKGNAKIELTEEERFGGKVEPMEKANEKPSTAQKKPATPKKPASKKPAPVRGRT